MALPTVADCKNYLRIEHTAEDAMLAVWLAQAIALVEAELGRPILYLKNRSFSIDASALAPHKLLVPLSPIAVADSSATTDDLLLTDADGTVLVEGTDYRLDVRTGVITALQGCFSRYPYTVVADVGLQALPEYLTHVEPAVSGAILDVVADRYQRRNPAATNEAVGADASAAFTTFAPGLPARVVAALAPWRLVPL